MEKDENIRINVEEALRNPELLKIYWNNAIFHSVCLRLRSGVSEFQLIEIIGDLCNVIENRTTEIIQMKHIKPN